MFNYSLSIRVVNGTTEIYKEMTFKVIADNLDTAKEKIEDSLSLTTGQTIEIVDIFYVQEIQKINEE